LPIEMVSDFSAQERWDTVVIGAGLGGLVAAAELTAAGRRVLVLERRPHPGGTAYAYRRGPFWFPMGPLGFSSTGPVRMALCRLEGGGLDLERVHYRVHGMGVDVKLSLPLTELAEELERVFPGDGGGLRTFFADVARIAGELQAGRGAGPAALTPADDYLRSAIRDSRLRRLLGSLGTRPPYSSLALIAAMWHLMTEEGIWHPRAGMRSLCDRLVAAVERSGGEVRLRREVAAIVVKNGRVAGVKLRDGTQLEARTVVSNADYKRTFGELVDGAALSARFARAVRAAPQTGSLVQVCLGLDRDRVDLSAFAGATRIIYRREEAVGAGAADWSAARVDPRRFAGEELEIALLSADDPTLAPSSGAVVVIRVHADYAQFTTFRTAVGRRTAEYGDYKRSQADALIAEVESLLPGLAGAVRVVDVATPLTFDELGGRSEGAIAGWSWSWNLEGEQEDALRELVCTPIEGLYMAGYQALSALYVGGVPTAVRSGERAAECVLLDVAPDPRPRLPGVAG
jgi:prolycopene isomerase